MSKTIFLIDDDHYYLKATKRFLGHRLGVEVSAFTDAQELVQALGDMTPALIITDTDMPEMTGPEVARLVRDHGYEGPVLQMSGRPLGGGLHPAVTRFLEKGDLDRITIEVADMLRQDS